MDSWEDRVVVVKLRIFFGVKDIIFCYSNHSVARGGGDRGLEWSRESNMGEGGDKLTCEKSGERSALEQD